MLSKKNESPDENGEIPTPPPLVTSKPEVFFIKYKNQEDSESVVNKIQGKNVCIFSISNEDNQLERLYNFINLLTVMTIFC